MHIKVLTNDLLDRMPAATVAIPNKPSLEILASLVLEAGDRGIRAWGTDLDLAFSFPLDGDVLESGAVAVNARALAKTLRAIGKGKAVDLSVDGASKLAIGLPSGATVRMPAHDVADLPIIPWPDAATAGERADGMIAAMCDAAHASADDGSRPVLQCLQVTAAAGAGLVSAADGFRLARVTFDAGGWTGSCNVSAKLAALLAKAKPLAPRVMVTGDESRQLWISGADGTMAGAFVRDAYTFPDTAKIVPSISTSCAFEGAALVEALKIARASGADLTLRCSARPSEQRLDIRAVAKGAVEVAALDIPAKFEGTAPEPFAINPAYLADAIEAGHSYRLGHEGGQRPILIERNGDGPPATFAVMPMHVAK